VSPCLSRAITITVMVLALTAICGCRTVGFYAQAIHGECSLLLHQRGIETILADPQASPELKQRLQLATNLCRFAQDQVKLPWDGDYRQYVDLHRRFVVWNVEAAPEFSLEARTWWYPLLGKLSYRGYFSEAAAQHYARSLQRHGLDVTLGGVPAYSTLGWFKDPLLSSFLFEPEEELAETLIHELAHQRLFLHGDTDFNEAFATAVGQEGARRWLMAKRGLPACQAYTAGLARTRQFAHLIATARRRLEDLYGDERRDGEKAHATTKMTGVPRAELRRRKQGLLDQLRTEYAALKIQWGGHDEYDAWFAAPLNNASLNSVATYYDLVPGFERILQSAGGDFIEFYRAAEQLSKLPKAERRRRLEGALPKAD